MSNEWWDAPLQHRKGSAIRLLGVDVFYDFPWHDFFPDNRVQFQNGVYLARLVRDACPPGKRAGLLLTAREDVEETSIETESQFTVVINFPHYLAQATNDPAAAYYAHRLKNITDLARLQEATRNPEVIDAVISQQLSFERVAAWAHEDVQRIDQLRRLVGDAPTGEPAAPVAAVLAALDALRGLDQDALEALEAVLGRVATREARLALTRILTADRLGRYVTSETLGDRLSDRVSDARRETGEYRNLLVNPESSETDLQAFIEVHPWLLGLEYVRVRPRRDVPRGALDFILERYDGTHDVLELKDPQDDIVKAPEEIDGVPPSASAFSLSKSVAQALAQIHFYRDVLTHDAATLARLYGLHDTESPRLIIVVGQAKSLRAHQKRVLTALNLSLHRVEIVPYDVIADRADALLANVEKYLALSPEDSLAV